MRALGSLVLTFGLVFGAAACQRTNKDKPSEGSGSALREHAGSGSGSGGGMAVRPKTEQIAPPIDIKTPPTDAVKTASGLVYKKLVAVADGASPHRNDTVLINYTGWRQTTGETFFSNKSRGQPMPLNLANTAPGFTEALQLLKKGEKAILWVPPAIGYKGAPQGTPETLVYEVEVTDIQPAPTIPEDVAKPPAKTESLKSGIKYVVVRPGTGTEKARFFDTTTFNYSGWESDGRMFDSTEMRKRPAVVPPFRQSPVMEEVLVSMTAGERVRFWVDADRMAKGGKAMPGMPQGQLCYEVEMLQIAKNAEPPPTPPDVAKAPADAKKSPKGVPYKMLKAGKGGPHPTAADTVRVSYTGWTTDGRMFDSSVTSGQPLERPLTGVISGWTDAIPMMAVGDKVRMWVPEELAYKGAPGKPQGVLVFDVELVEIKPPGAKPDGPPHAVRPPMRPGSSPGPVMPSHP